MGGCGGSGGDRRASSARPNPGRTGRAPAGTPARCRARPTNTARRPRAPRPDERRWLEKKKFPRTAPPPARAPLCSAAARLVFSLAAPVSHVTAGRPRGQQLLGPRPTAPALPATPPAAGSAARAARRPLRLTTPVPAGCPAAAGMATVRHRKRLTAGHGAARASRHGRPPATRPSPRRAPSLASLPPATPLLKSPGARAPDAPAPPRPGGSPTGKGLPGATLLPFVCRRPSRQCPALRGQAAATARRAAPARCPAASERASAPGRPSGSRCILTRVRISTQPSLGPEPQRRSPRDATPAARPAPALPESLCSPLHRNGCESGIDTQPPHTLSAGNITLNTAPSPLAAAKPAAAPIGRGPSIVLTRELSRLGAARDTSLRIERARKYKSEWREPGGGGM